MRPRRASCATARRRVAAYYGCMPQASRQPLGLALCTSYLARSLRSFLFLSLREIYTNTSASLSLSRSFVPVSLPSYSGLCLGGGDGALLLLSRGGIGHAPAGLVGLQPLLRKEHFELLAIYQRQRGADNNGITVTVLDDTGSTFLEIFDDDTRYLGIFPELLQVNPPITLITASVPVLRNTIYLHARILDPHANTPIGSWADIRAVVVPGPINRERCSGMSLRKSLYTATAPHAQGLLHIAAKKNGIVIHLPVL
jgi:hypothetical protein